MASIALEKRLQIERERTEILDGRCISGRKDEPYYNRRRGPHLLLRSYLPFALSPRRVITLLVAIAISLSFSSVILHS